MAEKEDCTNKGLHLAASLLQELCVLGQIVFLFFYSKINIQRCIFISRFGIMHVLATNFAVWIYLVGDEINHALYLHHLHGNRSNTGYLIGAVGKTNKSCRCHTAVCHVIFRANRFLSATVVIFSLIASCLLYVTWSNVGTKWGNSLASPSPIYKFYRSYKGVMMGMVMLLGTVIVITLMGSLESGVKPCLKNYFTEHRHLALYDGFLVFCNILILFGCVVTFYIYAIVDSTASKGFNVNLDLVLLLVCALGPLVMDFFSLLSLSTGPSSSKRNGWSLSLIQATSDVITNIAQILLIVHGFSREGATKSRYEVEPQRRASGQNSSGLP